MRGERVVVNVVVSHSVVTIEVVASLCHVAIADWIEECSILLECQVTTHLNSIFLILVH